MLRLSTKGRYGVRMMLELARAYGQGPVLLRKIAQRQEISEKYLGQLVMPLKTAGLLHSSRGAHGGYLLARPPQEVTVREIVEALEGPLGLVECVKAPEVCHRSEACETRRIWAEAGERLADLFDSMTLAELINEKQKKRIKPKAKGGRR